MRKSVYSELQGANVMCGSHGEQGPKKIHKVFPNDSMKPRDPIHVFFCLNQVQNKHLIFKIVSPG